jgi:hypothetical protein
MCSGKNLSSPSAGNKTLVLPKILLGYKDGKYSEGGLQANTDKGGSAIKE